MGRRCGVPDGDGRARVQPRTAAALHSHRADRGKHRSSPPGFDRRARLAAVRAFSAAVRPQPPRGHFCGNAHSVAAPSRRGPVDVLRGGAHSVAAGTAQVGPTAVVGGGHQRRLHVIFHPAVRDRRAVVAAQPRRLGSVRPAIRRAVVCRSDRLRAGAVGAAVGGRALHRRPDRRRPVQPTVHVPEPRGGARRRAAGRHAHAPSRRTPVCGTDLQPGLGHPAFALSAGLTRLRAGQREPGGGHPVAACRAVGDDRGVSVAPRPVVVAPTAGGLRADDGVHAGVLGRALRDRHPAGLGAGRDPAAGARPPRGALAAPTLSA